MAAATGKKGYTIKFELSIPGLLGVGVVCFCIFLWMFLLGLWAGQTGLISTTSFTASPAIQAAARVARNKAMEAPEVAPATVPEAAPVMTPEPVAPAQPLGDPAAVVPPQSSTAPAEAASKAEAATFFAIQVGAFRDPRYVEEALQEWRALGYEPFSRPPSGVNEHLTKVYIGHFSEAATARKEAEALAKKEEISAVVTMIPADPAKRP